MTALHRPTRRSSVPALTAAIVACVLGSGCGGSPETVVRGTVTLDGKPLAAGRVVFEGQGRSYMSLIAPDGGYEFRGAGPTGIVPGTYGVAILPPEPELVTDPKTTDLRQVNPFDPKQYPERFRSTATSGITRTVAAGASTIDVDLPTR